MSPLSPFAPFKFLKANANVRACSVPPGVTVTSGVPVLASTVAVTSVIVAAVPSVPGSPVSPFSPLRFLKVKTNVRACAVPPGVTVTSGVPVLASTVAVAPSIVATTPFSGASIHFVPPLPSLAKIFPSVPLSLGLDNLLYSFYP